jgi:hypothetical protein
MERQGKSSQRPLAGWAFWFLWITATTISWIIGRIISGEILGDDSVIIARVWDAVCRIGPSAMVWNWFLIALSVLMGVMVGALSGTMQWLLLRRHIPQAYRWIPASIVGLAVGTGIGDVLTSFVWKQVYEIYFLTAAVSLGISQWLVLRRHIPRAGWWVLAQVISLPVGYFFGAAAGRRMWVALNASPTPVVGSEFGGGIIRFATLGAVSGAITGGALVWLLMQRVTFEQQAS